MGQSGNEEELFIRAYKFLNGQENSFHFLLDKVTIYNDKHFKNK